MAEQQFDNQQSFGEVQFDPNATDSVKLNGVEINKTSTNNTTNSATNSKTVGSVEKGARISSRIVEAKNKKRARVVAIGLAIAIAIFSGAHGRLSDFNDDYDYDDDYTYTEDYDYEEVYEDDYDDIYDDLYYDYLGDEDVDVDVDDVLYSARCDDYEAINRYIGINYNVTVDAVMDELDLPEDITSGEKHAVRSAISYCLYSHLSYDGVIRQLEFEKYTPEEAKFAADHCGADWDEICEKATRTNLVYQGCSLESLRKYLSYDGFTEEQIMRATEDLDIDWGRMAIKNVEQALEYGSYSEQGMYEHLINDGFTPEQANHAIEVAYK